VLPKWQARVTRRAFDAMSWRAHKGTQDK
jgi:hypothetical protein